MTNDPIGEILEARKRRRPFPSPPQRLLIYGAGNRGREIRRVLETRGYSILGFIDQAADPGAMVDALPNWQPDDPQPFELHRNGADVVLGIYRCDLDLGGIADAVIARGYARPWSLYDLVERLGSIFSEPFWLTESAETAKNEDRIRGAFRALADEESRAVLLDCVRVRVLGDLSALRSPDHPRQYVPAGVPPPREPIRMVDGGAFTGDTFRSMRALGCSFEAYAGFEPDEANFNALSRFFRSLEAAPADLRLLQFGLWSEDQRLTFSGGGGEGSHLSAGSGSEIRCVALDEILNGFDPTFIKLDVEGAESEALKGAARTIRRLRPQLAVACYHRPEHLWSLLRQIEAENLGYTFYMRYHNYNDFDVVLYCVPSG